MTRFRWVLLGALLCLAGVAIPHAFDHLGVVVVAQAEQDPAKLTVYITKTGEKYHRDGCSSLRRSRIPVSLKEAVARGFEPCKLCRPPAIR